MGSPARIVLTTVGTEEEANEIAEELVRQRHSCCVNIVSGVRSVYRWQGEIKEDSEQMLVIKTLEGKLSELGAAIRELHSYELPEIIVMPVADVEERFMEWITACLQRPTAGDDAPADAAGALASEE